MFWIEVSLSLCTLFSIWMITNRKDGGVLLGFLLQFLWVYYWIFVTNQYGFVLIDCGMLLVFGSKLLKDYRGKR